MDPVWESEQRLKFRGQYTAITYVPMRVASGETDWIRDPAVAIEMGWREIPAPVMKRIKGIHGWI